MAAKKTKRLFTILDVGAGSDVGDGELNDSVYDSVEAALEGDVGPADGDRRFVVELVPVVELKAVRLERKPMKSWPAK